MPKPRKTLLWDKYLTREYSCLFISYGIECYKSVKSYVLAHGEGKLLSLYGIADDTQNCFKIINRTAAASPKKVLSMMNEYNNLVSKNYELIKRIKKESNKSAVRRLLIKLDKIFLKTLGYYIFFVYMGYAANMTGIRRFLKMHSKRFDKIRTYTIDTDIDKEFPKLFGQYNKKLKRIAHYLTRKEFAAILKNKPVNIKRIHDRKKQYLFIMNNKRVREYYHPQIAKVLKKELSHLKVDGKKTFVKGATACKGLVKGVVKVIFSATDYKKIEKGDIIVTPMTKPNIEPHLAKVGGIITNDGGALSHASIISRELSIPCIVGTKDATDVFQDGDIIKLNADKGVANKIIR